ncbi:hypothetical protein VTO73DRAFT_10441 [Trametes versicolor]
MPSTYSRPAHSLAPFHLGPSTLSACVALDGSHIQMLDDRSSKINTPYKFPRITWNMSTCAPLFKFSVDVEKQRHQIATWKAACADTNSTDTGALTGIYGTTAQPARVLAFSRSQTTLRFRKAFVYLYNDESAARQHRLREYCAALASISSPSLSGSASGAFTDSVMGSK